MLVLLYYLSQNPNFAESVKPLMSEIKNSEHMLSFLKDLSAFSETFSTFKQEPPKNNPNAKEPKQEEGAKEKNPQSPTTGIADAFIQNILDGYLKKRSDN